MASRRFGWVAGASPDLDHPRDRALAGFEPHQEDDRARWERATHATRQRVETRQRVRLTVTGGVMSAALVESPHLDWRRDAAACRYRSVVTPVGVTRAVRRLLAVLRLRHAALDFAVDRSGRWWLLEVNPAPAVDRRPAFAKGGRGGA